MGGSAARLSGLRQLDGSLYNDLSRTIRLIDLCHYFHNTKGTDPRDKVYAPRSLAIDLNASEMLPNYTRTFEQVYTDVVELYLRKNDNLDILGFVVQPAPDSTQMQGELQNRLTTTLDDACGGLQGSAPVVIGTKIRVQCHRVDKILRLSFICKQVAADMLRSWLVDKPGNIDPHTGETYEEAFSITSVVADIRYDPLEKSYSRGERMIWSSKEPPTRKDLLRLKPSDVSLSNMCLGRRFLHTFKGWIGIVPAAAAVGDFITVVSHSLVPLILRHAADGHYSLVGEFYIHGIMDGKAIGEDVDWEAILLQ